MKIIFLLIVLMTPGGEPEVVVGAAPTSEECRAMGDAIQARGQLAGVDVRYACIDADAMR